MASKDATDISLPNWLSIGSVADGPHLLRKCRTHPFDWGSSRTLRISMPFFSFGLSSPNILLDLRIRSSDSHFLHADFFLALLKSSTKRGFECWVEDSVLKTAI
jgi:hypothetical protein